MRKDHAYKGHEIFWNTLRMQWKMIEHILLWLMASQVCIFMSMTLAVLGKSGLLITLKYGTAKFLIWLSGLVPFPHFVKAIRFAIGAREIDIFAKVFHMKVSVCHVSLGEYLYYLSPYISHVSGSVWVAGILSFGVYIFSPKAVWYFSRKAKKLTTDTYVRGAKLISRRELKRQIRATRGGADLPVGNVRFPRSAEPKHCFVIGRPGVGKTVALSRILERLIERREKVIVYDNKGDYLAKFYNPQKDLVLNPLDTRCVGWSVFNEIKTISDIDAVAHSLISHAYSQDPFWNDAARDVFSGILYYLYFQDALKNSDIWDAVSAPGSEISHWLKNTPGSERGSRYIEDPSSKQAMGVFSVMMQYTKCFAVMRHADGDFHMDEWLNSDKGGAIYVTNYRLTRDTLRPILSLFIDLMSQKLLSMPDDHNRRVFFMLDEFATLQRLSSLVDLLTLSRSKGGSVWLGTQDIGQIERLYGAALRQSIVNACGSSLIFAVADPQTAEYLSRKIGDIEYIEMDETVTASVEDNRDGFSMMRRHKTKRLLMASELTNLPDLTALLKIVNYDIAKVKLKYHHYENVNEPVVVRPEVNLANFIDRARLQAESPTRDICLGKFQCDNDVDIPENPGETRIGDNQPEPDNNTAHKDESADLEMADVNFP